MRLFLTSMAISYTQGRVFLDLVGKKHSKDVKVALIENAADVYAEGNKDWMYENRSSIQALGFNVDLVDLEDYRLGKKGLLDRLKESDAIWLGGGNTYYLRWILKETRADSMIRGLVERGKVYGGGSAGAIIAGPTINYFQPADNPDEAPEEILTGLGITDTVIVPHWGNEKYGEIMKGVSEKLVENGYAPVHLTDEQAYIINGEAEFILG